MCSGVGKIGKGKEGIAAQAVDDLPLYLGTCLIHSFTDFTETVKSGIVREINTKNVVRVKCWEPATLTGWHWRGGMKGSR